MRRVTGMRDRIVPRVQMAPGINHPRRARAARAGAAARGLLPAPPRCCEHRDLEHPPPRASRPRAAAGREAAPSAAAGAKNEARRFEGGGFNPLRLQGQCCTRALKRWGFSRRWWRGGGQCRAGTCPPLLLQPERPHPSLQENQQQKSRRRWPLFKN